jgi:hypothetical protein
VLHAQAADAAAAEKQPLESLMLLAAILSDAEDRVVAAAVLQVANRRFPRDFWICYEQSAEAKRLKPSIDEEP